MAINRRKVQSESGRGYVCPRDAPAVRDPRKSHRQTPPSLTLPPTATERRMLGAKHLGPRDGGRRGGRGGKSSQPNASRSAPVLGQRERVLGHQCPWQGHDLPPGRFRGRGASEGQTADLQGERWDFAGRELTDRCPLVCLRTPPRGLVGPGGLGVGPNEKTISCVRYLPLLESLKSVTHSNRVFGRTQTSHVSSEQPRREGGRVWPSLCL